MPPAMMSVPVFYVAVCFSTRSHFTFKIVASFSSFDAVGGDMEGSLDPF